MKKEDTLLRGVRTFLYATLLLGLVTTGVVWSGDKIPNQHGSLRTDTPGQPDKLFNSNFENDAMMTYSFSGGSLVITPLSWDDEKGGYCTANGEYCLIIDGDEFEYVQYDLAGNPVAVVASGTVKTN